jgi:PmbA protein
MPDHEVFFHNSESTSLTFGGGELKIKETDVFSGYGVRVLQDGRIGFAYCQKEDEIDSTIEKARKLSKFSVKNDFSFSSKSSFENPDILDKSLDPYDYDMLGSMLKELREGTEIFGGKSRIIVSTDNSTISLHNTSGFSGEYKKSEISLYAECMNGEGFGFSYVGSNKKPTEIKELGLKAAGMARDMQGAKKPESGTYTVVMQIEALENLVEILLPSFSGDWKRRGISKIPNLSFSEKLTICDDGLAEGTGARPFDDEGTPSEKRYLVKNGKVESFLYDRETAALAEVEASGACDRSSFADHPSVGPSNITIAPGDWNDLGEIDNAHGSHTANLTSGDLGLEASAAFLVEKDKRTPLKGFMVTGNVFEMFANIEAVENKSRSLGWLVAPRIAFKDVKIVS